MIEKHYACNICRERFKEGFTLFFGAGARLKLEPLSDRSDCHICKRCTDQLFNEMCNSEVAIGELKK